MNTTGLYFASATGKTRRLVDQITAEWQDTIEVRELHDSHPMDLLNHDVLLLGSPTYGIGSLHHDWPEFLASLTQLNLSEKTVGLFVMGDGRYHGNSFAGALGLLYDAVMETGARISGRLPQEDYQFASTTSIRNDSFPGLIADWSTPTERRKTQRRIGSWIKQLKSEHPEN